MPIKYEIHTIENAVGSGEERPYAQLSTGSAMTADRLAAVIEEACSVTKADVKAVLTELGYLARRELSDGNRFYIPEIGYLSLSVGIGSDKNEENHKVTGNDLFLRNINFKPEANLLNTVKKNAHFEKSAFSSLSVKLSEAEVWSKISSIFSHRRYVTRRMVMESLGQTGYMAQKWLNHFCDKGKLIKDGTRHQTIYFEASPSPS